MTLHCLPPVSSLGWMDMMDGHGASGVDVLGCQRQSASFCFPIPCFAFSWPGPLMHAWRRDKATAGQICLALGEESGCGGRSSIFLGDNPQLNKCLSVEITPARPGWWRQRACCQVEVKQVPRLMLGHPSLFSG